MIVPSNPRWCLFLTLLAVAGPAHLAAQSQATTGIMRGTVTDEAGQPVAGARVTLTETGTNYLREVRTSGAGVYIATLLPLGTYTVEIRAVGRQEFRQTDIQIRVGETADLKIVLGAAVQLEAIEITSTVPAVDPTRSEAATRFPDQAVEQIPNNKRNFLDLTLFAPNVAIVQGPDGDELTIAGQKGIHNNISVDGADYNNPFFGEQRGGQRPPFTFNLDAVQEIVVISQGANAEFGRSGGGFVNVITKSGTNEFQGSVNWFGKYSSLAATSNHAFSDGSTLSRSPDFDQNQFGFTFGGPIVRDKAFFFVAFDGQLRNDTRQQERTALIDPGLRAWVDTAFGGVLAQDYGSISRTDDARAFFAKLDFRLGRKHNLSLKYNHTWSEQQNGTFDVDTWLRSSNANEKGFSNAINGQLTSFLGPKWSNEFRFQVGREDRPRSYPGPLIPGSQPIEGVEGLSGRPFPDTGMDFAAGYRLGLPFFIPVEYYDSRIQILDNVQWTTGNHIFKFGAEYNRVESVQTFIGFAHSRMIFGSVDGFLNYNRFGNGYVECSGGGSSTSGACPAGEDITGPVVLYLQQEGVGSNTAVSAGTQKIPQHDLGIFIQDSWKVHPNLTLNLGLRWEGQVQPNVLTPPAEVFFADFIGTTATTSAGTFAFPSDGTIPSDLSMWQPRLGFAWDTKGNGSSVLRGAAGIYYPRIPGLNLASARSTNGSLGQTIFRSSEASPFLGPPPNYGELLPKPTGDPFQPGVFVYDRNFRNPRTFSASIGYQQELGSTLSGGVSYVYAYTDRLTRFVDRNGAEFGNPWSTGLGPDDDGDGVGDNGVGVLTTVESSAKSRYHGITFELAYKNAFNLDALRFDVNYTLSWDKSDDDNERDPFTFRYFNATDFGPDYNWSDRDQRHRFNLWQLGQFPFGLVVNNALRFQTAQPVTETCGANNQGSGTRAANLQDPARLCANGSVLQRNTLRKDNAFFSWDLYMSWPFRIGRYGTLEPILQVFNITNSDNFLDPTTGGLLFNFDGTVGAGLGNPREVQFGMRYKF